MPVNHVGASAGRAFADAWLLAAIGPVTSWVPLRRLVSAADHYQHAVPDPDEAARAIDHLVTAGVVEVADAGIRPTDVGLRLWREAGGAGGHDLVTRLEWLLATVEFRGRSGAMTPERWVAATARRAPWWRRWRSGSR